MSVIAAALKHMLAAGMPHDAIVKAVAEMEAAAPKVDAQAERRRERDRDRKRSVRGNPQTSADSAETADIAENPLPLPPSPQTPQPPTPSPVVVSTRAREADDFARFWEAYPHKVSKGAAERAFAKAIKLAPITEMLAAIARYRMTKPPDRDWCNPATWLNGKRWTDQPAELDLHERPHSRPASNSRAEGRGVWADLAAEEARAGAGRA